MKSSRFQVGKMGDRSLDVDMLADVTMETQLHVSLCHVLFLQLFFGSAGEMQYNIDIHVS